MFVIYIYICKPNIVVGYLPQHFENIKLLFFTWSGSALPLTRELAPSDLPALTFSQENSQSNPSKIKLEGQKMWENFPFSLQLCYIHVHVCEFCFNFPSSISHSTFPIFTPLALKHKFHKPGSQAIIEMSRKNITCGYACPVHYKKLFHHQGGYYNSLIASSGFTSPGERDQ